MVIDLHGLGHHTARHVIEDRIVQASLKGSFDAEIITGKSVIMERVAIGVLEDLGIDYVTFPEDFGIIYVSYTHL